MNQATPAIRDLARLLLALEANRSEPPAEEADTGVSAFEKLRSHLSKLIGIVSFETLLVRALALSKTEAGWLEAVRVSVDATLVGFRETARRQPAEAVTEGSAALLAQLLTLLDTLIGEALTLRLMRDVWPEDIGMSKQGVVSIG